MESFYDEVIQTTTPFSAKPRQINRNQTQDATYMYF